MSMQAMIMHFIRQLKGQLTMQARTIRSKLVDAVHNRSIEELTVLLAAGCDSYSSDTITAFTSACARGYVDIVKVLIAAGVNIHAKDEEALNWAAEGGHAEVVKLLIEAGANITVNDYQPLKNAMRRKYLEVVKLLIEAGADITQIDNYKEKLLKMI